MSKCCYFAQNTTQTMARTDKSPVTSELLHDWSCKGHRTAVGEALLLLAREDQGIYVVNADVTPTARLTHFQQEFPQRLLNVGIAEQNMISFTAGLAKAGLLPFAVTLAAFVPMRCAEQLRSQIGYMDLNAKIIGIEAGVRFGPLGNTHFSMDDLAVARAIPNFTVLAPCDPHQIYKAIAAAAKHSGPVYIRLTGAPGFPVLYPEDFNFRIGEAIEYQAGRDVALVSTGSMLGEAIKAARLLEKEGLSVRIVDMHTVKPLDTGKLEQIFKENSLIVTLEEHSVIGGLGSAVAEYKARFADAPAQLICGLKDEFMAVGSYEWQLEQNGLTAAQVAELVLQTI